jgi:3-hydroxy-9,10-secoandrosta-1,3,5(10)-triene-9,17-dione monooxygenase reductase component
VSDPSSSSSTGPVIDEARFRQVLGHFPTGVTVVAAQAAGEPPVGMAVGSFFSVSLEPALVGFCPGKSSTSWPKIEAAGSFCVNILADDQEDVARVFAGKGEDKFQSVGWRPAVTGSPVIRDVLAWVDCAITDVHEAGDHFIVTGRVNELKVEREGHPLVFFRGGYGSFAT